MQLFKTLCYCIIAPCFAIARGDESNQPLVVTQDKNELCIWIQLPSSTAVAKTWILYSGAPAQSRIIASGELANTASDKIVTHSLAIGLSPVFVLRIFDSNGTLTATYLHRFDAGNQQAPSLAESATEKFGLLGAGALLTLLGGLATILVKQLLEKKHERANKHDELRTSVVELSTLVFSPEMLSEVDGIQLQDLIKRTAALSYYDKRAAPLQSLLVELMTLHSGAGYVNDHGRFQAQYLHARTQWQETVTKWS